jgi:hypothetical protein
MHHSFIMINLDRHRGTWCLSMLCRRMELYLGPWLARQKNFKFPEVLTKLISIYFVLYRKGKNTVISLIGTSLRAFLFSIVKCTKCTFLALERKKPCFTSYFASSPYQAAWSPQSHIRKWGIFVASVYVAKLDQMDLIHVFQVKIQTNFSTKISWLFIF